MIETVIAMGVTALGTALIEKILVAMGKNDNAQMVSIGGTSLIGAQTVILIVKFIKAVRTLK